MSGTGDPLVQPPAGDPVARLEHVSVQRDGQRILSDIDWEIGGGERWVLFGANGSGKTTLIDVLSTYSRPTHGLVTLFGRRSGTVDVRDLRKRIGYVGPAPTSYVRTHLRSIDIVVTGLHASFVDTHWHHYTDVDWDFANACLCTVQGENLTERTFSTLSDGEKKRVLIARALMTGPELLLLDEPGSSLDLGARERLVDSLAALAAELTSPPVVLVTHHVEDIPPGFDHILMLAGGRMVAKGRLEEVLTSQTLSTAFEMPLEVEQRGQRWRAWSP